jgi:hypothetical protein
MLCTRCGGLLMQNWWDSKESVQERMPSTRCVNCGCIDDPVIRANRRQSSRVRLTPTRARVRHAEVAVLHA